MMYIILFIGILGLFLFKLFDMINAQFRTKTSSSSEEITQSLSETTQSLPKLKPNKMDLTEIYKDIDLQPYGCFSSLDEKFFLKKINPYTNSNVFDSGLIISEDNRKKDTHELITQVINNGFGTYAYYIFNKYDNDPDGYSKNMDIKEFAILGKLAGYDYLSVYKLNESTRGKIYLTYSPPMETQLGFNATTDEYNNNLTKSNLPTYTLIPKLNNYTNENEKTPGKELACGYPCLPNDKPMTFNENGTTKQYMCGSVGFPDIKTPPRFAVYKIVEKV